MGKGRVCTNRWEGRGLSKIWMRKVKIKMAKELTSLL